MDNKAQTPLFFEMLIIRELWGVISPHLYNIESDGIYFPATLLSPPKIGLLAHTRGKWKWWALLDAVALFRID